MSEPLTATTTTRPTGSWWSFTVIVAALGYFVDIYDIVLFSVVRKPSLEALGIDPKLGPDLLSWQMIGMLVGGVVWGVLGDRIGRKRVLFGSIILYSLANLANALIGVVPMGVDHFTAYAVLRVLAGLGLAGELGAAITLVAESTAPAVRGYATAMVAGIGVAGAVMAVAVTKITDWRMAYVVGGLLGFSLLIMRLKVFESGMFEDIRQSDARRGSLLLLFARPERVMRFILCIVIGLPLWCVVGILVMLSPEIGKALHATAEVDSAYAVLWCYVGLIAGDLASGAISQWLRSRRFAVLGFLALTAALTVAYLSASGPTPTVIYAYCGGLGFACGFWALFVTIAAEQFGTNLRATVATTAPNVVRGTVPLFIYLKKTLAPMMGMTEAVMTITLVTIGLAAVAILMLKETHGSDLDHVER